MPLVGSGVIGHGSAEAFDVFLTAGHTYAIAVQPTEPGVDFDLHVFDQNGKSGGPGQQLRAGRLLRHHPRLDGTVPLGG
jgi:hypothetical protein